MIIDLLSESTVALETIACCHDRTIEVFLLRGYRQNHGGLNVLSSSQRGVPRAPPNFLAKRSTRVASANSARSMQPIVEAKPGS
jgi:hypothetical protein